MTENIKPQSGQQLGPQPQPVKQPTEPKAKSGLVAYLEQGIEKVKAKIISLPPGTRKVLAIGLAAVTIFLLLILVLAIATRGRRQTQPTTLPSPTPISSQFTAPIENPSKYATDEAVLAAKEEVDKIDEKIKATDLENPTILPPDLDYKIDFED